jgi:hypothetical protein
MTDTEAALTPRDREQIQILWLRRWLAQKVERGTRRKTDYAGPVKRFNIAGDRV